jgi:hypothetical protein
MRGSRGVEAFLLEREAKRLVDFKPERAIKDPDTNKNALHAFSRKDKYSSGPFRFKL